MAKKKAKKTLKLKINRNFSGKYLIIFAAIFALIGGYFVYHSFAGPSIATVQAEQMSLPANAKIINDTDASGGKAVVMQSTGTLNATVSLPTQAVSLTVKAKGNKCKGSWPKFSLSLDNSKVLNSSASNVSWSSYSLTKNITSGTHGLSISYTNDFNSKSCNGSLYLDVTTFYGPDSQPPATTVSITASPQSVSAGSSSTLTWTSNNASSCTASGAWSGDKSLSGSMSIGPINANSTYILTCSGASGSATASAAVTVAQVTAPSEHVKIYGANNFVGWTGDYSSVKNLLGINGERVCHDETTLSSSLPKLAAAKIYLSICVNSEEPMKSLDSHKQDFANTTASLTKTYGPGGTFWSGRTDGQYAIQTFEIMNEPYGWWYRNGDNDPTAYAHIAAAAIKAGKAANPNAKFYIPLAPSDVKLSNGTWVNWNQAILNAEPTLFQLADGFSIHLYGTPSFFTSTLDKWQAWAWSKTGGNGKPFIITESNLTDQYASSEQDYINSIPQFVQAAKNRSWVNELFIFCYHGFSGRDYLGFLDSQGNVRQTRANSYKNAIVQAQQQ